MSNPIRTIMIERRAALGWTQADAAAKARCNVNTWGRWESTIRLPHPGAWLRIAKALGLTLGQLQRAAAKSLLSQSGGEAEQPGKTSEEARKPVSPDDYEFLSVDAQFLDKLLVNYDLHKLPQGGWHFHMEHWRSSLRELARAVDLLVRLGSEQNMLFQRLHNILLGNETGRILPLPKIKRPQKMTTPPEKRGGGGGKGKKRR